MKILHLINYFNDNLEYQENILIKLQQNNGHEVCLITSDRYFPFKNYSEQYKKHLGERIVGSKSYFYKNAKIIRKKVFFEIKKHAQCFFFNILDVAKYNPDIIHIHNCGTYNFILVLIYSSIFKKKVFIDCHQDDDNTQNSKLIKFHNFLWKNIYKIFNSTIIKFLPINKNSENYIKKNYDIKKKKIIISPLGYEKYNKNNFVYKKNINYFKLFDQKRKKSYVIINSGKQNFSKKIHLLIDLVKILNLKKKNFKLILIGSSDKKYNKFLNLKIQKVNNIIGNKCIIRLPLQKKSFLREYLSISDMGIWPGIPSITIQEAMFLDNIVMLPKNSASYDLITSKYLTFHENINKTAENIIKIFNNKNLLKSIRIKNKNLIKKLEWIEINKNLEKIYNLK